VILQIVLRLVVAAALVFQGGMAANAAGAAPGHHCTMGMHHDGGAKKCPCCPAKSFADCGDLCLTAAPLPVAMSLVLPVPKIAPAPVAQARWIAASIDMPLRPPIA
jgi:hypothetical protein